LRESSAGNRPLEIVLSYAGPRGSGKTTSLDVLRQAIGRGELAGVVGTSIASIGKAPIDFLYFEVERMGRAKLGFRITSLPQIEDYFHLWKMILRGSHGVVMVADSQMEKMEENQSCMRRIVDSLNLWRKPVQEFPLILQYNKSDLPGALPKEVLDEKLNLFGKTSLTSSAVNREGILPAFISITQEIMPRREESAGRNAGVTGGASL
jgi:GTPase SAR1 family protein